MVFFPDSSRVSVNEAGLLTPESTPKKKSSDSPELSLLSLDSNDNKGVSDCLAKPNISVCADKETTRSDTDSPICQVPKRAENCHTAASRESASDSQNVKEKKDSTQSSKDKKSSEKTRGRPRGKKAASATVTVTDDQKPKQKKSVKCVHLHVIRSHMNMGDLYVFSLV